MLSRYFHKTTPPKNLYKQKIYFFLKQECMSQGNRHISLNKKFNWVGKIVLIANVLMVYLKTPLHFRLFSKKAN